jgi:hypothetical protein
MSSDYDLDLVVLTAGDDERQVLTSILDDRRESLRIRVVSHQILKHPRRDPGCLNEAETILQPFCRRAHHALVIFDHEGSGMESADPVDIERSVSERLFAGGWGDRAATLVIVPELETWVWSDSPEVERVFEWSEGRTAMTRFLLDAGVAAGETGKFRPPKRAVELVLQRTGLKRSSALYGELARSVSLHRCVDPSFKRLATLLADWFPAF